MLLKNNRIPKYFALLLFCFELFAPVLISAEQWVGKDYGRKTLHEKSSTYLLFSTLVSEEAGSEEERDSKVHNRCFFNLLCSTAKSLNYLSLLLEKVAFSKDFIHNPVITIERLYSHFGFLEFDFVFSLRSSPGLEQSPIFISGNKAFYYKLQTTKSKRPWAK